MFVTKIEELSLDPNNLSFTRLVFRHANRIMSAMPSWLMSPTHLTSTLLLYNDVIFKSFDITSKSSSAESRNRFVNSFIHF